MIELGPQPQDVVSTLASVRALIADPQNWTQKVYARNAAGEQVGLDAKDAKCFCLYAAIHHVTKAKRQSVWPAMDAIYEAVGSTAFAFNDTHPHLEVISALDRTIELERVKA